MNERIVAIIPIRSLGNGKTRLAPVLDHEARAGLLRQTAASVVAAARDSGSIETTLVVSPDAETLAWVAGLGPGVTPMLQPASSPGLNGAIEAGREWARGQGAGAVLSLFADLPFLDAADVRQMTARRESLVLGPDRRTEGTNALLLRLAGNGAKFQFAFGEGSLSRHREEARRLGMDVGLFRARGVAFDLDTPADWADFVDTRAGALSLTEINREPCGAAIA